MTPRIFIADFDLEGFSGHFFNQLLGFREAARERGLEARVFVRDTAMPDVVARLDARAILPAVPWRYEKDDQFAALADARRVLAPLWRDLDAIGTRASDLLIVTSSRAQVIFGTNQWLDGLSPNERPTVCIRFNGPEFFDFDTMEFKPRAWSYHFVSRFASGSPSGDRILFTINNADAVSLLERLTQRPAFFAPIPKYYGASVRAREPHAEGPATVYIHANRPLAMPALIEQLVGALLERRSDLNFLIRFCKHAFKREAEPAPIQRSLIGERVELLPAEQDEVGYLDALERSEMVLLPYDAVEYRGIVSGIFCEAAALGKVIIAPAGTWMARQLTDGLAAGAVFEGGTVADIAATVERALAERTLLREQALQRAGRFREENSCARNLERLLELAAGKHDMRLPYVPVTDVHDLLVQQRYLVDGWSAAVERHGVWTDGERAALRLQIRPGGGHLVFSAEVYPFFSPRQAELSVSVAVNGVPAADWRFNAADFVSGEATWRTVRVTADAAATGEIRIELRFSRLQSPMEMGLSGDPRRLGLLLQRFSLLPEADGSLMASAAGPGHFGMTGSST